MSLVNQIDSAVQGSPCSSTIQDTEEDPCSQVTFYEPNSEAAGSEGQENIPSRGLPALLQNSCGMKTPQNKVLMFLTPNQLQVPKGLLPYHSLPHFSVSGKLCCSQIYFC